MPSEIPIPYTRPRAITPARTLAAALLWNPIVAALTPGRDWRACALWVIAAIALRQALPRMLSLPFDAPGLRRAPVIALCVAAMTLHVLSRGTAVPHLSATAFEIVVLSSWQALLVFVVLAYRASPTLDSVDLTLRAAVLWTGFPAACASVAAGHVVAIPVLIPLGVALAVQARLMLRGRWLARVATGRRPPWRLAQESRSNAVLLARPLSLAGPFRGSDALVTVAVVRAGKCGS